MFRKKKILGLSSIQNLSSGLLNLWIRKKEKHTTEKTNNHNNIQWLVGKQTIALKNNKKPLGDKWVTETLNKSLG